jgi:hypothetical protein
VRLTIVPNSHQRPHLPLPNIAPLTRNQSRRTRSGRSLEKFETLAIHSKRAQAQKTHRRNDQWASYQAVLVLTRTYYPDFRPDTFPYFLFPPPNHPDYKRFPYRLSHQIARVILGWKGEYPEVLWRIHLDPSRADEYHPFIHWTDYAVHRIPLVQRPILRQRAGLPEYSHEAYLYGLEPVDETA